MSDEQALTTRATIDAWLEAGWATPDTPDWLSGGYVTKERAQTALRMLADQIDALRSSLDTLYAFRAMPPLIEVPPGGDLDKYLAGITPENVQPEVPTTPAKGKTA